MNRTLLTLVASVALYSFTPLQGLADSSDSSHHTALHDNKEEMAKECEAHLGKIKDDGSALPNDKKAEFEYDRNIMALEVEALKDPNHRDPKRHFRSCQSHFKEAEHILKKHEDQMVREKKKEERKAREEERKKQAEARKAEREAAKAKREVEKAEKAASHHAKNHETAGGLDHGKSEGASEEKPGADVAMPMAEEKK